jgi:hypothetical protein
MLFEFEVVSMLGSKFLCTVAKHLNDDGFIVTVYTTYKIKRGEVLWKKS